MHLSEVVIIIIYYKIGPVVHQEKIFLFGECTLAIFLIISRCKKVHVVFPFEQTQILFTQGCFLPSLVEICSLVL